MNIQNKKIVWQIWEANQHIISTCNIHETKTCDHNGLAPESCKFRNRLYFCWNHNFYLYYDFVQWNEFRMVLFGWMWFHFISLLTGRLKQTERWMFIWNSQKHFKNVWCKGKPRNDCIRIIFEAHFRSSAGNCPQRRCYFSTGRL